MFFNCFYLIWRPLFNRGCYAEPPWVPHVLSHSINFATSKHELVVATVEFDVVAVVFNELVLYLSRPIFETHVVLFGWCWPDVLILSPLWRSSCESMCWRHARKPVYYAIYQSLQSTLHPDITRASRLIKAWSKKITKKYPRRVE